MYLTYEEYVSMGGDLSESDFTQEEFKARKRIDYWTDSRVSGMQTVPGAVKQCMMELIKANAKYDACAIADNPLVESFSTDGYTENYGSAEEQLSMIQASLYRSAKHLLFGKTDDNGIPLLYRGI